MLRTRERTREIDAAVADIRAIEQREGVTHESLEGIKQRLIALAARTDLFTVADFPPPEKGGERFSCLYRISEDADHRALSKPGSAGHAPGSTTWAVIAGVTGEN